MRESPPELQDEINKRHTLNLLIQGAAGHASLTSHYLVRDELMAIDPRLIQLYDQFSLGGFVQYWSREAALIFGPLDRSWRSATSRGGLFFQFPLLSQHGHALAEAGKERAIERCKVKDVSIDPEDSTWQMLKCLLEIEAREKGYKTALVQLAKRATQQIWGMPIHRQRGSLTRSVRMGRQTPPINFRERLLRSAAGGYGGVMRKEGELRVIARAWVWPLLSHELVKGTAELICLHGLSSLDEQTYDEVLRITDRIEYEPWMLQAGPELWRRLLALFPRDRALPEMLMHIARLPAQSLERLMFAVVENEVLARQLLSKLGDEQ